MSSSSAVGGAWFPAAGCSLQVTVLSGSCQLSGCIVGKKVWQRTMRDLRVCGAHFTVFFFFLCLYVLLLTRSIFWRPRRVFSSRSVVFLLVGQPRLVSKARHRCRQILALCLQLKPILHLAGVTMLTLTLRITKGPTMYLLLESDCEHGGQLIFFPQWPQLQYCCKKKKNLLGPKS